MKRREFLKHSAVIPGALILSAGGKDVLEANATEIPLSLADKGFDQRLTDVVTSQQDRELSLSERVFPIVEVSDECGFFFTFDFPTDPKPTRTITKRVYGCDLWELYEDADMGHLFETPEERIDGASDISRSLTIPDAITRDRSWADKFFQNGLWRHEEKDLSWNEPTSDPIHNVKRSAFQMASRYGFRPNVMVMGSDVFDILSQHPNITKDVPSLSGKADPKASREDIARLFELKEILVPSGVRTSKDGAPSCVCSKNALLCYRSTYPSRYFPSAGYTFAWRGETGKNSHGSRIRRFQMKSGKDRFQLESTYDQRLVSSSLGCFFSNAIG